MAEPRWRVAIVDSGLDARSGVGPAASCRFVDVADAVATGEVAGDATGHGTAVAEIIVSGIGISQQIVKPELLIAQAMDAQGRSTPAAVAAAVRWALSIHANLIHLSLGLASDRAILASAIADAIAEGVVVVAATPARGLVSFPAAYPGVIRATGDARCGINEISVLDSNGGHFGARAAHNASYGRELRGASVGAAYLTRFLVSHLAPCRSGSAMGRCLSRLAGYRGAEVRAAG